MRLIALAFISLLMLPMSALAEDTPGQIVVTGFGKASAAPDKATVFVTVSRTSRQTGLAMEEVAEVSTRILETLTSFGVTEDDIKSTRLTQEEAWDIVDDVRTFKGFEVANSLTVTLRDLSKVGSVMAALSRDGATGVRGPNYDVEDESALRDAARQAAVRDGMKTARLLAEAAEVTLGAPNLISDGTPLEDGLLRDFVIIEEPVSEATPIDGAEPAAPAVPLIPADIETTETVKLIFRINP